jgi:hypothetical protein
MIPLLESSEFFKAALGLYYDYISSLNLDCKNVHLNNDQQSQDCNYLCREGNERRVIRDFN